MVAIPSIADNEPACRPSQAEDHHPHLHDITDQARTQDAFVGHECIVLARDRAARLVAIVAGSANNPLVAVSDGELLRARGILYAPDFVINAGGLLHVAAEYAGLGPELTRRRIDAIGDTLAAIFRRAEAEGLPTNVVAERLAHERLRRPGRTGMRRRA